MKNNKYIVGLNLYHGDSAACIMRNNEVTFAIEEERLNRIKHWAGIPVEALKKCLEHEKINIEQASGIAINFNRWSNLVPKINYSLKNIFDLPFFINKLINKEKRLSLNQQFKSIFKNEKIPKFYFYDHHSCHHASSFYFSNQVNSLSISADGFGDFVSTSACEMSQNKIKNLLKIFFPHSLGIFYQAFTQFLGFLNYGDEYKLMGLSAYGGDKFYSRLENIINYKDNKYKLNLNYFTHHKNEISFNWNGSSPKISQLYNQNLEKLFPEISMSNFSQVHMDLAYSVQKKYEEILFKIIKSLSQNKKFENLCLSGGCAMNSLANGRIIEYFKPKEIYVPASPGDSGGCIGAAVNCHIEKFGKEDFFVKNFYLGTSYDNKSIFDIINKKLSSSTYSINKLIDNEIIKTVAHKLNQNNIIGWFRGRMEWGPRALGSRSILANPSGHKIKDLINLKIKRRESFRPFAPSILIEEVKNWFEIDKNVPFMSSVLKIKKEKRALIPAVTHVDGTGRLQTVCRQDNEIYYDLIKYFGEISGIPILLNTSFNENEPMVESPDQAIDCFLRTEMDILVIENYIIERK